MKGFSVVFVELPTRFHQKQVQLHAGSDALVGSHWLRFAPRVQSRRTAVATTVRRLEDMLRRLCLRAFRRSTGKAKNYLMWSRLAHCPPSGASSKYSVRICRKTYLCPFCYGRRLERLFDVIAAQFRKFPDGGLVFLRDDVEVEKLDMLSYRGHAVQAANRLKKRLKNATEKHFGGCLLRMAFPRRGKVIYRTCLLAVIEKQAEMPLRVSPPSAVLPASATPRQLALFLFRHLPYPKSLLFGEPQALTRFWRGRMAPPVTRSLVFFAGWATLGDQVEE